MANSKQRYPFNLFDEDAALFTKIKDKVEARVGIKVATVDVIRLALKELAKKEKVA